MKFENLFSRPEKGLKFREIVWSFGKVMEILAKWRCSFSLVISIPPLMSKFIFLVTSYFFSFPVIVEILCKMSGDRSWKSFLRKSLARSWKNQKSWLPRKCRNLVLISLSYSLPSTICLMFAIVCVICLKISEVLSYNSTFSSMSLFCHQSDVKIWNWNSFCIKWSTLYHQIQMFWDSTEAKE